MSTMPLDLEAPADPKVAERVARAHQVHEQSFGSHRAARSETYRDGCLAALLQRADGGERACPYRAGSLHADAWHAGFAEGHARALREL
ncbi:MAG: hypothetical protein ACTHK2_04655 [Dokdonella sp.]|uniref:hypothetical protein n=1 Tax=Dokdonella sp. TaxID=2291710 RepID=UPI003F7FFED6